MTQSARLIVTGTLLLAAFGVLQLRSAGEAVPIRKALDGFPEAIGDWRTRQDSALQTEIVNVLKIDDYLMRRYVDRAGNSLWLYVGYWGSQHRGAAQVHSPRNCLPASGWEPIEASRIAIEVPGPRRTLTVNRYLIQKDRQMQVVMYWYHAQGVPVAGEIPAKIHMVRSAFWRNRTDGALVRVSGQVSESVSATSDRLIRYVQALYPRLGDYLPD
jgi:EpsI family protein